MSDRFFEIFAYSPKLSVAPHKILESTLFSNTPKCTLEETDLTKSIMLRTSRSSSSRQKGATLMFIR